MPFVTSCGSGNRGKDIAPWGESIEADTVAGLFDLEDIEYSGELLALTISGPGSAYDYHGRQLGLHAMLCQRFADFLGVRLRLEMCRDTSEMCERLLRGDADLIAFPLDKDSLGMGWRIGAGKERLAEAYAKWFNPSLIAEVTAEEKRVLASGGVRRKVYSPMLDRSKGTISAYDHLFKRYARTIGWDWRLLASQCYQESTFDPQARSWAGARGLMQIMPGTAEHLGLALSDINDPEKNIAAAVQYLKELEQSFSDISHFRERQDFVLAAYNGGTHHIRDAMALAKRDGRSPYHWKEVAVYVNRLSEPEYYEDPTVRNGYMRGSETVNYVDAIRNRWRGYRGVKSPVSSASAPQKARNERHKRKFQAHWVASE